MKMSFQMNEEETKQLKNCMALLDTSKTLQLATVDSQGIPHISYAPFVRKDEDFFIYVSQLASHTEYLQQTPTVSLMIICDEAQSKNLFARERLIIEADATVLDQMAHNSVLDNMEASFGGTVALLRSLPDFVLFKLSAVNARYIAGFGKAFQLDMQKMQLEHVSAEKLAKR